MTVLVALLRAVNLGGKNRMAMDRLRAVCTKLGLRNPATYIQSGNVVFDAPGEVVPTISARLSAAIEREFGFQAEAVVRTTAELAAIAAANPFRTAAENEPNKLLVVFLVSEPDQGARERLATLTAAGEAVRLAGREIYIHYPAGAGSSKLTAAKLERACGVPGTARNWNTVMKLLAMAQAREAT